MERIVVTGLGIVSPVGTGRHSFWDALCSGRSGIGAVTSFDTSAFPVDRGAEVRELAPERHLKTLDPGELGRASQMAATAARLALEDAGLEGDGADGLPAPERCGVVMGTTSGEPREVEALSDAWVAGKLDRMDPGFMIRYPCHTIASNVAAEVGFAGVARMIPTACAAGNYALAHAFDLLRSGRLELALAGGADSFSRITYTGFARLGAIAPDTCRPFDRSRRGMVPGEGAGVLVLEPLSAARRRGAPVYAELAGYGLSCDAHHMTAAHPEGAGAARAMERALETSGVSRSGVSWISAHGTGTPTNDRLEVVAVERVFGADAPPISSVKSMLGHTMGAASALEAAACCLAISNGRIPPTVNFEAPDEGVDLDFVPNQAREARVQVAMNNAYAFGGNNASAIFREVAP